MLNSSSFPYAGFLLILLMFGDYLHIYKVTRKEQRGPKILDMGFQSIRVNNGVAVLW